MQVFEVRQERNTTVATIEIAVFDVGSLVNIEVTQWIELRSLLCVFLGKPDLIRTEDVLIKQSRFMSRKYQLTFSRRTL